MEININKYCRVCTKHNAEMLSVFENYKFSEYNLRIFEVIAKCASVQIQRLDGFSERICKRCTEHLRQAFSFKQLCEQSDYKFRYNLIDAHKIECQNAGCFEATKIRCSEVKVNEINEEVNIFLSEIKSEFHEENPKIQYGLSHEEVKKDFVTSQNLDASLRETTPAIFANKKSRMSQLNLNFNCNNEQSDCTVATGEINGENVRRNISNEAGYEIKSEFRVGGTNVALGALKNQNEETSSSTAQNLTGELLVNLQKSNENLHNYKFCEQSSIATTIVEENTLENTDGELMEAVFIKQEAIHLTESDNKNYKFCDQSVIATTILNEHPGANTDEELMEAVFIKQEAIHLTESDNENYKFCNQSVFATTILNDYTGANTDEEPMEAVFIKQETMDSSKSEGNNKLIVYQGEKLYECKICNKAFMTHISLNRHNYWHTEGKPHECETCGKTFKRKDHLENHRRIHTGEKPYMCDTCNKCFATRGKLSIHVRIHTGQKRYKCDTCDKCFTLKEQLKIHVRIHTGEKQFKCEICGKCFTDPSGLNRHKKTHTGEKPHKCETCGKCFVIKVALTIHMRSHTGEKPYRCEFCDKRFVAKTNLNVHMRIHTGEKPFRCDVCDRCFIQRAQLIQHCKIHTVTNKVL